MSSLGRFFLFLVFNFVVKFTAGVGISSKIDLDDERTTPPDTLSSSVLKAFVDINQGAGFAPKPSGISSKLPARGFRRPTGRPADEHLQIDEDDDDYISIDDLFKGKRQKIRQNPVSASLISNGQSFYGEPDVKPTIVNNIHVTINANDSSGTGVNGCENGVCNVRVYSKPDAEGNVITNVHLSVVTKLNKPPVLVDVPVIEGTAGNRSPEFDQLPAFHFVDQHVGYGAGGSFHDNNIPQIPIHRQDVDSWYYQPPAIFERTRPVNWHYGRNLERSFKDSQTPQGHRDWTGARNGGIVDDKIEPPLSKTKPSSDKN